MDLSPSPVHHQQRRCPRPLAQRIFGVAPWTPKAYLGHRHSCPDVRSGLTGDLGVAGHIKIDRYRLCSIYLYIILFYIYYLPSSQLKLHHLLSFSRLLMSILAAILRTLKQLVKGGSWLTPFQPLMASGVVIQGNPVVDRCCL